MGFYKNTIIAFGVVLAILLTIMAYIIVDKNETQEFPARLSMCPDYYSLNESGHCKTDNNIYSNKEPRCIQMEPTGMSIIQKREWASDCGVAWDGITNSSNI